MVVDNADKFVLVYDEKSTYERLDTLVSSDEDHIVLETHNNDLVVYFHNGYLMITEETHRVSKDFGIVRVRIFKLEEVL